jgi:hypothetical protein
VLANAVCLACVAFAFILLMYDQEGWGWFLLIAVLSGIVPSTTEKKK